MNLLRASWMRLRSLFRKELLDRELHDELASHLEMHIEDNLRTGMPPEQARREALLKLGGLEQTKESIRDLRGLPLLETLYASPSVRSGRIPASLRSRFSPSPLASVPTPPFSASFMES
jgi:hypothetical protein